MAVVVCGEALIDLIPDNSRAGTTQSSYWQAHSAGGPLNTAVALSRLGMPTRFLGRFGIDGFGAQLRSHLRANGVDDSLGVQTLAGSTSLSVVSVDSSGAARYVFHLRGTANFGWKPEEFPQLDADDWLHTGSLVATVEPGRSALLDFVRTTPAHLSYDLNVRPTVEPDPDAYLALIDPFVQVVSQRGGVVRASDEDLLWLAGGHGEIDDLARAAVERYGMDLLVVTLGAHGALATGVGRETVRVPGFPAPWSTPWGSCYRSGAFADALGDEVKHKWTRPYRPQTNGKVERFNRTLAVEWAYAKPYASEAERAAAYETWLHHYNHHRPHTGIGGQTPSARVHNVTGKYT
ncbi:carbohydrate kinase [Propionibacterium freudenreichii]|nr:carbohydrate kinase [Propionibacterium freudenreichii]